MPKRKRETTAASGKPPPPVIMNPAKQAKYCQKRLEDAQKPLLQALRHASQLERQKHSRRKKDAIKKGQTEAVSRLNAEYNVLKALNLEQLGDQHLRKTLSRVKSLKDAEPLQEYISGIREGSKDTSTLNVTARMFKVVQVKKAVDEVVEDLKRILGVDKAKDNEKAEEKHKEEKLTGKAQRTKGAEKDDVEMKDASDEEDDPYMAFSARIAAPSSGEEDDEGSVSGDERPPSIADSESEHDPDDDLEAESDSQDEAEEVAQSGDTTDDEDENNDTVAISRSVAPASDESSADSDADSDSDEAVIPTKKPKTKAALEKPTSSAFLPALSHAAYFSGSESEASDLDADNAPRKNRRGQRARQKIAEAKFGAKAKHLEKQQQNVKFDPKRGAVAGDDKRQRRGKPMGGRGVQQSGSNAEPLGKKDDKKDRKMGLGVKRDDKGELHPSWQAAKLAKESKKLKIDLGGKGPAQGKKVVFD
ncbi:Bud-site selection protein [Alternaria rosae]|uniref:Bud-site selection protein n=1 Tax=Alternaria rosae TaxID=1187941 RepID=UPI001E8DAFCB|nr:Bud-site selection protein [Alternaria rosae]KAH6865716.1 Bud-site selection protein [Alternaria rosae]